VQLTPATAMGSASPGLAERTDSRRWLVRSLRNSPLNVFTRCLRRQRLEDHSNACQGKFDSLVDVELGEQPASPSRTTERGTPKMSEDSEPTAEPQHGASEASAQQDIELVSALRDLAAETDLRRSSREAADTALGELVVLERIWESQTLLKTAPVNADGAAERRTSFQSRLRSSLATWAFSEECHARLQELVDLHEADEFLNNATLAALQELLARSAICLQQARRRSELSQILRSRPATEDDRCRALELLGTDALKGHPVLEFKVRRALGLPMTVQWTPDLGLGTQPSTGVDEPASPRAARTIPSNLSTADL